LMDVNEALQDGAHIVTVPPSILRKMLWNPRTESTIEEFNTAWRNRSRS
jgi:transaldolase